MPTISTGNPGWDQNLSTLGNALFPDPSKVGQGYYYGSQARKEQIEAAKIQDQMAAGHTALGMQFGRQPNPTYRSGAFDTTIMNDPGMSGAPMGAAPGPAAAPGATPSLAQTILTTPPAQLANGIVAGVENHATTGPGALPTGSDGSVPQNGTGSVHPASVTSAGGGGPVYAPPAAPDGTPAPAAFNWGQYVNLMIQGGATPQAAQAAATATMANMVKNGQMAVPLAEQMAAFMGVPNMRVQTQSNEGALARTNVEQAGALARTNVEQAASTARTGMALQAVIDENDPTKTRFIPLAQAQKPGGVTGFTPGAATEAFKPVEVQSDPAKPPTLMPQSQAIAGQVPLYDKTVAAHREQHGGEYGKYIRLDQPLRPFSMRKDQAAADKNIVAVPASPEEVTGTLQQALNNVRKGSPEEQRLIEQYTRLAAIPKGPVSAEEALKQREGNYRLNQELYAVPQTGKINFGVKDPIIFDDDAQKLINDKTEELQLQNRRYLANPTEAHDAAVRALWKEGKIETPEQVNVRRGPARTRVTTVGLAGDERVTQVPAPGGKGATDHMVVRAIKPGQQPETRATPQTPAPSVPATPQQRTPPAPSPPVSSVVVPRAGGRSSTTVPVPPPATIIGVNPSVPPPVLGRPAAAPPAAAPPAAAPVGRAPAGTPEGATIYYPGTNTVAGVNRGGLVYPQ